MSKEIVNRVANSDLKTIDLEDYLPKHAVVMFDLAPLLWQGQILKEKHFREQLSELDAGMYEGKSLAVNVPVDAIVPAWVYMLLTSHFKGVIRIAVGSVESIEDDILMSNLERLDASEFEDGRILIKGCGNRKLPDDAYALISQKLLPVVKTLMFGEACSFVPVFKRK